MVGTAVDEGETEERVLGVSLGVTRTVCHWRPGREVDVGHIPPGLRRGTVEFREWSVPPLSTRGTRTESVQGESKGQR